jgi:hypothetical protein
LFGRTANCHEGNIGKVVPYLQCGIRSSSTGNYHGVRTHIKRTQIGFKLTEINVACRSQWNFGDVAEVL